MLDKTGRDITYLRLSITDRCNCRCLYCMPESGAPLMRHEDILSFEEMEKIVRQAAALGVRKVRVTGGEPLCRRDVVDLVAMIKAVPGIEEVAMTTNATLLAPLARPLKEAGLDRVNVSLDTLDPERYRQITRTGELSDALAGIRAAEEAGLLPIKINCVLMGGVNDQDVRPLAELARDRAVSVRFIELMPIGEAAPWPRERFVPCESVLEALPELEPLACDPLADGALRFPAPAPHDGVADLYGAPGWKGTVGLIHPVSHRFCSQCNRVRVTSDGKLKPCLHSAAELPLRGLEGEGLLRAIEEGIASKPGQHTMGDGHASESARAMFAIGG